MTWVVTKSWAKKTACSQPCDLIPSEDKHVSLPRFSHKSNLKAASSSEDKLRGKKLSCPFRLACGVSSGSCSAVTKEVSVFNSEFFKLHIQSTSLVLVLCFCSKSCFLLHLKSTCRSFFCWGAWLLAAWIRFGRKLGGGGEHHVAFPTDCPWQLQWLSIVHSWLRSGEDTIVCCPLGVREFDLMVLGGSDAMITCCPGMWFSCHLRSQSRTMA